MWVDPAPCGGDRGAPRRVPALTVLFHPDPARIGHVARLGNLCGGARCELSGTTPSFSAPGMLGGPPLHLPDGEAALELISPGEGVRVCPGGALRIDGRECQGPVELGAEALERGAVLELGGAVLLFHWARPLRRRQPGLGMAGISDAMEELRARVLELAPLDAPLLVRGEPGCGKELAARALVAQGPRAGRPFVAVNLAALPISTAASELFGDAAGAFGSATSPHAGLFDEADGGTLFLHDIAAAPRDVQGMLLRALDGEILPVGAAQAHEVDVRVIAAGGGGLEAALERGSFLPELHRRLLGAELAVPPLRARRADLGLLALHFRAQADTGAAQELTAAAVASLAGRDYPGNVREFRNAVRRFLFSGELPGGEGALSPPLRLPEPAAAPPRPRHPRPRELSPEQILEALRRSEFRAAAAARALGVSRSALYELLEKVPGIRKAKDIPEEELRQCLDGCQGDVDLTASKLQVSPRGLRLRLKELKIR